MREVPVTQHIIERAIIRLVLVEVSSTQLSTGILRTAQVECYGDDTPLTFHDTLLFTLLILLVHTSKFNVHNTSITLPLKLTLHVLPGRRERNAKFSN